MKKTEIRRGDIFSYDFGTRIGSIQSGVRPVLVIQADNFNANAPKLYEMTSLADCPFVLWVGNRRMIKRRIFDEYIEQMYSI